MKKSEKKISEKKIFWITLIVAVVITLLLNWLVYTSFSGRGGLGGRSPSGNQASAEIVIFDGTQNTASWSADGNHDHIVYESDASDVANGTSVSVGDVISFNTASGSLSTPLDVNEYYYVVSVSYSDTDYEDRFEISTTKGGTNVGTIASTYYSQYTVLFFEEIPETGEVDIEGFREISFNVHAEELPSVGFRFMVSNMETAPDWYESPSADNRWGYLDVYDIQDGTSIDGTTGIANTVGGNVASMFHPSFLDSAKWFFIQSDNYASGNLDLRLKGF